VRRALAVLLLSLAPSVAAAQTAVDAGGEIDALQAELDRDSTLALASDCAIACRALESMRHAADRLCALDPGDRCARARQKVEDASGRVRTSCPTCATELDAAEKGAAGPPSPTPVETVAQEEQVQRGCGGCAAGRGPVDAVAPLAVGALAAALLRRRRKR
jgi:MYXO-CTERM domain-containing protein